MDKASQRAIKPAVGDVSIERNPSRHRQQIEDRCQLFQALQQQSNIVSGKNANFSPLILNDIFNVAWMRIVIIETKTYRIYPVLLEKKRVSVKGKSTGRDNKMLLVTCSICVRNILNHILLLGTQTHFLAGRNDQQHGSIIIMKCNNLEISSLCKLILQHPGKLINRYQRNRQEHLWVNQPTHLKRHKYNYIFK